MTGVNIFRCPDGKSFSFFRDLHDCPGANGLVIEGGATGGPSRFLGAREIEAVGTIPEEAIIETAKPGPFDFKRKITIGLLGLGAILLLFLLLKRRKRK